MATTWTVEQRYFNRRKIERWFRSLGKEKCTYSENENVWKFTAPRYWTQAEERWLLDTKNDNSTVLSAEEGKEISINN